MSAILINGEVRDSLSVLDRGLHYGDGVFETIKVMHGRAQLLEQHLQRLHEGCKRLRISQPSLEVLTGEINALARGQTRGIVKVLITRGEGGRGYRLPEHARSNRILIRYEFPLYPPDYYLQGVRIRLCSATLSANPQLAGIKHLNRLEQILARSEWQDDSFADGLMADPQGRIIEGTMSNVFLVNNARLITPDVSRCGVAGIMRRQVITAAQELGIPIDISEVKPEDLMRAGEVFLTNSVIGIWPVRTLVPRGDAPIDYAVGPVTRQLMHALAQSESQGQGD